MSGKTSTPVCPVSQGGLYEGILAGVCTGNPHTRTHRHSYRHAKEQHAETHASTRTHRLMTEEALSEVKYLREMPHIANWLWWASASMPWCFLFFLFLFIPQFPLYRHKDNLEKIHKIAYFFCEIYKPQILENIPNRWCMVYCYYKYANLTNPRWGIWFIMCLNINIASQQHTPFDTCGDGSERKCQLPLPRPFSGKLLGDGTQ